MKTIRSKQGKLYRVGILVTTIIIAIMQTGNSQAAKSILCKPAPEISLSVVYELWMAENLTGFTSLGGTHQAQKEQQSFKLTYKIKNGQVRLYSGDSNTGQIITTKGDHIMLMENPGMGKWYMKQSASQMKQQQEMLRNQPKLFIGSAAPTSIIKDDQSRVIDNRGADLYLGTSADGKTKYEFWVTRAVDEVDLVKQALTCASHHIDLSTEDILNQLPGIVVEQVTTTEGKDTSRMRLLSISRDPIPDNEFEIPAGYRSQQEIMMQRSKTQPSTHGVPAFPGMPDIPGVPKQK